MVVAKVLSRGGALALGVVTLGAALALSMKLEMRLQVV
jgi:hypothetical protein